ncbi:MAG: RHS repeat-associated core domain-containing protein, partial [Terriglobia bacterium]
SDRLYYPWGQGWGATGGIFAGIPEWDGRINHRAAFHRNYPDYLGRWLSPDPAGRGAVSLSNPQTWNAYSYAGNNPTTNTDPSGRDYKVCTNDQNGDQTCTRVTDDAAFQEALANPGAGITTSYNAKTNSGDIYATGANGQQQLAGTFKWAPPNDAVLPNNDTFFGAATLFVGGGLGIIRDLGEVGGEEMENVGEAAINRSVGEGNSAATGTSSDYTAVTKPGSRLPNRVTNVAPQEFGDNLQAEGFRKSVQGDVTVYTKGDTQYTVYPVSKSTGGPTAQVSVGGKPVAKIRLQQ